MCKSGKSIARLVVTALVAWADAGTFGETYRLSFDKTSKPKSAQVSGMISAYDSSEAQQGTLQSVRLAREETPMIRQTLKVGDEVTFDLFGNRTLNLKLIEKMSDQFGGGETFLGELEGYGGIRNVTLVRSSDGFVSANVEDFKNGRAYAIHSGTNGAYAAELDPMSFGDRIDRSKTPVFPKSESLQMSKTREVSNFKAADNSGLTYVDVLVAYDSKGKSWAESNGGGMTTFANLAVNKMNTAIGNTGLTWSFKFRLVGVTSVPSAAVGASADAKLEYALEAAKDGIPGWTNIRAARDKYSADIVTVLIDHGSSSGMTGLGYSYHHTSGVMFAGFAYNACAIRAVNAGHTMTHEVGHNMGCGHSDKQSASPGPQDYAYSSGYYFTAGGRKYHTIMAYADDGHGNRYAECPFFSSPNYTYNGTTVGTASYNDNTRTIRDNYVTVSLFRTVLANDAFSAASLLSGSSGSVTASNVGATEESGEPLLSYKPSATTTVWWKWTAPSSGKVWFDTIGSGFDTVMGVYTGSSLSSLTKVAEDDDGADSGNASKCEFDCESGTCYYIAVAGYGGGAGTVKINWLLTPGSVVPAAPTGVMATDGTYTDKVRVSWSEASGATSFNLYRSTTTSRPSTATKTDVTSPYNDTTATPGTKYYYWIAAVNSAGSSVSSCDTGYRAVSLALDKSTDSYAASGGSGSASVTANTSWSASADVSWITFGTKSGNGNGTLTYTVAANSTTASRTGTITVTAGSGTSYPETKTIAVVESAAVAMGTALNNTTLSFTTGGNASWYGQEEISHDGNSSMRSGAIGNNQSSWLQTTVRGPGTISFWWKVDSEERYDWLKLYVDGSPVNSCKISGTGSDWTQVSESISGSGSHTVQWEYSKDSSNARGEDAGFVDQVVWTPSTTFVVMFAANGGTGTVDVQAMKSESVYKLPPCTFTPPAGKTRFVGWACSNGRRYDDGMLVFNLAQPGETVTMTAIWE